MTARSTPKERRRGRLGSLLRPMGGWRDQPGSRPVGERLQKRNGRLHPGRASLRRSRPRRGGGWQLHLLRRARGKRRPRRVRGETLAKWGAWGAKKSRGRTVLGATRGIRGCRKAPLLPRGCGKGGGRPLGWWQRREGPKPAGLRIKRWRRRGERRHRGRRRSSRAEQNTEIPCKWICDVLSDEFTQYSNVEITQTPEDADVIWLLAAWRYDKLDPQLYVNKFVVTTIHHIEFDTYSADSAMYKAVDQITTRYHVTCNKVKKDLRKITFKEIIVSNFWINENVFIPMNSSKNIFRQQFQIPSNVYAVGSFQKDTDKNDTTKPLNNKGADILFGILLDMRVTKPNLFVVLTGYFREYLITRLQSAQIPFIYHQCVTRENLNKLYNTLDLYVVASRVEGGPRAIMECAITRTPIISTDVGIADTILNKLSIFNMGGPLSYASTTPDIITAATNVDQYKIATYMPTFVAKILTKP